MKYLTLVICVALLTSGQTPNSSSPSKCSLTREQAPEIRGIRLGMSAEQLSALFPEDGNRQRIMEAVKQSKLSDNYGVGRLDLRAEKAVANPRLSGTDSITVELLDERVTSFHIFYVGPEWKNVDQFVARLSDALRLSSSWWVPEDELQRSLKCDGFRVDAGAVNGVSRSWVRMQDTSAPLVVENRRETAKEKLRQAFKP